MVRRLRSFVCASVLSSAMCGWSAGPASSQETASIASTTPASLSAAYREFHDHIIEISKLRLDNPSNQKHAQDLLVSPPEQQLSRGWVASFAEIASQSTPFAQGLKKAARDEGTDALVADLRANPSKVFSIGGVDAAEKDVMAAISEDTSIYSALSHRLSEIAYGRTENEAELAHQAQAAPFAAGISGATRPLSPLSTKASPLMSQVLALGAVISLTSPSSEKDVKFTALTANTENDQCLRWARLNLNQCIAAAKDGQERAYCLSQHGIDERSKCWSWVSQPGT